MKTYKEFLDDTGFVKKQPFDMNDVIAVGNMLGLIFLPLKDLKKLKVEGKLYWGMVNPEQLLIGLAVELEHFDITNGDLLMTAKIALAHLAESCEYYIELEKMEKKFK